MRDLGRLVKGYTCAVFGLRVGPPGSIFRPWKVAFLFFRQRKIFWEHFGKHARMVRKPETWRLHVFKDVQKDGSERNEDKEDPRVRGVRSLIPASIGSWQLFLLGSNFGLTTVLCLTTF